MITVTRLGGSELIINAELIELVEATPDTVITLTTGRKLVVADSVADIVERCIAYRRRTHPAQMEGPHWISQPSSAS